MMAAGNQNEIADASKSQEPRVESSFRLLQVMSSYGREFCFLLAVIFTAFAAFQNGPLKTRKANPPQRFFPLSSLVTDFYVGNMQGLSSLLLENDVSIVMYYAPWDAACIQARSEFETAARFYHAQVFFAAVNCWWPEGECRKSLKLQSYPLLLAHVRRTGSVTYSGPLLATYLVPFLDSVLSPVYPIHQQGELLDLQAQHEAVMVGYFEFHSSPQPPGYRQFYIAALKTLNRDPSRRLGFAVVTSRQAAVRLRFTQESVVLHLWNDTKVYPESLIKNENLVTWAYNNLNQVCTWLSPSGMKSRLMSQILEKSPTIILFTPRNLMLGPPPYYDLLRETAMSYFNCNQSASATSIIHRIILKRHIRQKDFEKLRETCNPRNVDMTGKDSSFASSCCQSVLLPKISSRRRNTKEPNCFCSVCIYSADGWTVSSSDEVCMPSLENALLSRRLHRGCCDGRRFTSPVKSNPFFSSSFKCLSRQSEFAKLTLSQAVGTSSKVSGVEDDRIKKMSLSKKKQECRHLNLALKYSTFNFPITVAQPGMTYWQANFSGMACRTNRTLNFMALDTVLHHSFAEHLGVDIYSMPHQTAAIIVEAKQESQFLLPEVNKHSLVDFIKNFTNGRLDRYLRSVASPYPSSQLEELAGAISVLEVTTDTFNEIVLNPRKDVVLMYYAPWCVFCSGIAHIYLTVAKFFSEVDGITFARINGDLNDLPWEYTVEKYPTILFLPANRKSESVEYPTNLPVNNINLIQFVLANAQPSVRWKTAMQLCDGECQTQNALQSSMQVQDLFLELRTLRNQLHHLEDYLFGLAKDESIKSSKESLSSSSSSNVFKDSESNQWQSLTEYRKHLVEILRSKKRKIRQARELQKFLRRRGRAPKTEEMEKLRKELVIVETQSKPIKNVIVEETKKAPTLLKPKRSDEPIGKFKFDNKGKKAVDNLKEEQITTKDSSYNKNDKVTKLDKENKLHKENKLDKENKLVNANKLDKENKLNIDVQEEKKTTLKVEMNEEASSPKSKPKFTSKPKLDANEKPKRSILKKKKKLTDEL